MSCAQAEIGQCQVRLGDTTWISGATRRYEFVLCCTAQDRARISAAGGGVESYLPSPGVRRNRISRCDVCLRDPRGEHTVNEVEGRRFWGRSEQGKHHPPSLCPWLPKESITTGTTADLNVPSCASGLSPLWLGRVAAEKRLSCLEQVSAEEGLAVPGDTSVCCLLFSLHACRPAEEMII